MSQNKRRDLTMEQPITRACDMCRRKKIRCELTSGTCLQCQKFKTDCHFTPISVKRKPRRPVGDKRVEQLEKRLKWMESQLEQAIESSQLRTLAPRTEPGVSETPTSDHVQSERYHLAHKHTTASLDHDLTTTEAVPKITEIAVSSPKEYFAPVSVNSMSQSPWNIKSIGDEFARMSFKVLPPKDEALSLIKTSFQGFNSALPLFDEATFISTFESMDWNISDPGWWACLNVVLALTHRFGSTTKFDSEDDREAWGYFQNALAVTNQLTTMNSTLLSVQALLGISIALMGTPNINPASILISSAIKQAQSMGLHRKFREEGLSTAEIEQRRRVFWIAFCLDKDISLRSGQPPTQDDDDMDVELPLENTGPPTRPGRPHSVSYFNFRVRLALIQGQIYKRLCSVKATKQSVTERLTVARQLEVDLQNWRANIPPSLYRNGGNVKLTRHEASLEGIALPLGLQLPYFTALGTMYDSLPIPPIMSSPTNYATEASRTIQLLQSTPRGHNACMRAVLHIFVSATVTLLNHIISNPSNPLVVADLKLIEPLLNILPVLAAKDKSENVYQMYRSCSELFLRARQAVDRSNLERVRWEEQRSLEQPSGKESVEDFLRRIEYISSGYEVEPS